MEAKFKELEYELRIARSDIKSTVEYKKLKRLYLEEEIRANTSTSKLKSKVEIERANNSYKIDVERYKKKLDMCTTNQNLEPKLLQSEEELAKYKTLYNEGIERIDRMQSNLNEDIQRGLYKLNIDKRHLEIAIDCMFHGCNNFEYRKYDRTNNPDSLSHLKKQLEDVNKKIDLLYTCKT